MLKIPKHGKNWRGSIFVIFFSNSDKKRARKKIALVVYEILRLLVNILTPDEKYSLSVKASV